MLKKIVKFKFYDFQMNAVFQVLKISFGDLSDESVTVAVIVNDTEIQRHLLKKEGVLLEFTNFMDADGNEIYEDDILLNEDGRKFRVEWNTNQSCWWLSPVISDTEFLSEDWPMIHLENQMLGNGYLKRRDMKLVDNANIKHNGKKH